MMNWLKKHFRSVSPKKEIPYFLSADYMLARNTEMYANMARGIGNAYREYAKYDAVLGIAPKSDEEINAAIAQCVADIEEAGRKARKEAAEKGVQ